MQSSACIIVTANNLSGLLIAGHQYERDRLVVSLEKQEKVTASDNKVATAGGL